MKTLIEGIEDADLIGKLVRLTGRKDGQPFSTKARILAVTATQLSVEELDDDGNLTDLYTHMRDGVHSVTQPEALRQYIGMDDDSPHRLRTGIVCETLDGNTLTVGDTEAPDPNTGELTMHFCIVTNVDGEIKRWDPTGGDLLRALQLVLRGCR